MIEVVHCDEALLAAALDDLPALAARLGAQVAEDLDPAEHSEPVWRWERRRP